MNIINIEHIYKIYGEKTVFEDASFGIHEGDKIGIVGINGTGKSTLLKMTAGLEMPDTGQIIRQNNLKIAYLPQNPEFPANTTILSYIQDCEAQWRVESYLTKLGIQEYDTLISHLSGGQKRKVALAKVLATDFDVLLLDEPTNHLDEQMISWLEDYLKAFRGTILMVTHDRYFLDQVTNKILEISHGKAYDYEADYSGFLEMKAAREEMELASERKRQSVLCIELEWAKRGCRARSTKQRARLERLEALKNGAPPVRDQTVELDQVETRMGKKTIELRHLSKGFGDKKIVQDFNYIFLKNQKVGIIGPNGCGKSTLIKMLAGLLEPDSGTIETGETIRIGYFAQEEQPMDDRQRVIDYVKDIGEYITTKEGQISASQMLERFLFTPDMQYAPIGKLSGGEKQRLYLLGVIFQNVNVLLLDEASNNLDIPTLTILEDYLNSFVGIVVTVSHDRYFLDNVVDRILVFEEDGKLRQYEGGYTDYSEARKKETEQDFAGAQNTEKAAASKTGKGAKAKTEKVLDEGVSGDGKKSGKKDWRQNRPQKLRFSYKEQKEYETIDGGIQELETELARLDEEIAANATNSMRLSQLMEEKAKQETLLEEKMERWVYLQELAEKIMEAKKNGGLDSPM